MVHARLLLALFDAAAMLLAVPFDDLSNRPLVLELGGDADGDGGARRCSSTSDRPREHERVT